MHHHHHRPQSLATVAATSDPIFSSDESYPEEHKFDEDGTGIVQYPDPEAQGLDEDIKVTHKNLGESEKYWGKKWTYDFKEDMPQFGIPGKP